ncbi:MAG: 4Fe-4S binding protein [Christensenellaceae bacterium]|jgi:NAD-dependent dihydropyrimidine dehydrogenase PreA subunit|nr:4Fe-4S binding protein [Christensenellaceae bacterium]
MSYVIEEADCVACGLCAGGCPVSAIDEGPSCYVIDPDLCISCGSCAAECPSSAIHE